MALQEISISDPPGAAFTAPVAAGIKQFTERQRERQRERARGPESRESEPLSPAAVDTLSTEAFAPVAALWEDEMARVTCFGKGSALELVGRFAGVSLSRVKCTRTQAGSLSLSRARALPASLSHTHTHTRGHGQTGRRVPAPSCQQPL